MADKLKLATNVPVEIALKFDEGKPFTGEFGDSVMYTLTDDRVWFAPPIVADKITKLGITRGEPFLVCKAEVAKGNRRTVEYQVSRLEAEPITAKELEVTTPHLVPPAAIGSQHSNPSVSRELPPTVALLARACAYAVDIAQMTEAHAAERGYNVRFTSEDVRALANTLFINGAKESAKWVA